jgi:pimeloyl-ACP methyl ester carboxylesterase
MRAHVHPTGFWLLLGLMLCGCSPSRFIANRFIKAPNSYPTWFAPEPRVYLGYQPRITDRLQLEAMLATWSAYFTNGSIRTNAAFPLQTNATQLAGLVPRFGNDPARIVYRVVPPAAYNLTVTATNWTENGVQKAEFGFRRAIPAHPLPGLKRPSGTVFLLHGYGLDHETMLPWAFWLGERGYQSILVDLRGHGRTSGKSISFGPVEVAELRALLSHLQSQDRISGPVFAMGVSYGATLALRWAGTDPRLDSAIAIAPYARLADAIENIRADFASWVPASWIGAGVRKLPEVVGVQAGELDPLEVLKTHPTHALLMAGGADVIAPVEAVERLQHACLAGSRLWVLMDSNHEALPFRFPELAPPVGRWISERQSTLRTRLPELPRSPAPGGQSLTTPTR